jgi:hypothetical protein
MPDTLPGVEPETAVSSEPVVAVRPRWTRTHTIWLLMGLSLLPGAVIAMDREMWTTLPAGVRAAVYLVCAALIVAAVGLIVFGRDRERSP